MKHKLSIETTSAFLHILAMGLMLCDHLWATVVPGNDWLTCVGRLAFPIFAFMIVEGYFHTHSVKKYMVRLLVFAVLSEIPFNLMAGGWIFYPVHQNVLWTFLIALVMIQWNEKAKATGKLWLRFLTAAGTMLFGGVAGLLAMVDYYHAGVLMVLVFYFFRERIWWCRAAQLVLLWWINAEVLGGIGYEFQLFGRSFFLARQSLAVLALIPIWLYRGKQGYHSKWFRWLCYGFYPAHLLVLGILQRL